MSASSLPHLDSATIERLLVLRENIQAEGEDVLAELLRLFQTDSEQRLAQLRVAVAAGDAAAAGSSAHAWKGAALNVGAGRLAALLVELEVSLRQGAPESAAIVEQVAQALSAAVPALAEAFRAASSA